jgi:hypothetical protein
MGNAMVNHIGEYLTADGDLSYYADRELDYQAERLGKSKEEILALMSISFGAR